MYGHGFATLFLGEVYGMTGDETVKEKLQKAVRLIEKTQNPEGGWRYQPAPYDADISVTICQVMAPRAPRDAGIKVEKEVIDKAIEYVKRCQNPDGGFSYMASRAAAGAAASRAPPRASRPSTTPASSRATTSRSGLKYLKQFTPGHGAGSCNEGHYFYGHYYAVQAMFLAGGDYWANLYPAIRDELIASQAKARRRSLGRRLQRRLRHRHGPDHPADAQPLPARLRRQRAGKLIPRVIGTGLQPVQNS